MTLKTSIQVSRRSSFPASVHAGREARRGGRARGHQQGHRAGHAGRAGRPPVRPRRARAPAEGAVQAQLLLLLKGGHGQEGGLWGRRHRREVDQRE